MENRKINFENNKKEKISQEKAIPTPEKENYLVKPDFSPILIKENQIGFKKYGSYKKAKLYEPISPIKSPNFKSSIKIEGKNLFGSNQSTASNSSFSKKLNFDDYSDDKNIFFGSKNKIHPEYFNKNNKLNMFLEKCDEEDEIENEELNNQHKNDFSPKIGIGAKISPNNSTNSKHEEITSIRKCSINIENYKEILKTNKFENEFNLLKPIKQNKLSSIYKVEEIKTKKIFCIKKIVKTSPKSNIDILKKITKDFKDNYNNLENIFCLKIIDFWIEKEEFNILLSESNFCDKNLYILYDYFKNGDIFDYLENLEQMNFKFTEDFYWDITFEMFMGVLFVHNCGYLHMNIQPGNFLVDDDGYLKLNDFNLSLKIKEIPLLDDITEGDSRYISKEVFHFKKNKKLNEKCDIFSLGLSLLELIAKIELPYNGPLWHEFRDENFKLSEKYFHKSNIENINEFVTLISQMILPFDKRPTLKELIKSFPKLSQRYQNLLNGKYKKCSNIPKFDSNDLKIDFKSSINQVIV